MFIRSVNHHFWVVTLAVFQCLKTISCPNCCFSMHRWTFYNFQGSIRPDWALLFIVVLTFLLWKIKQDFRLMWAYGYTSMVFWFRSDDLLQPVHACLFSSSFLVKCSVLGHGLCAMDQCMHAAAAVLLVKWCCCCYLRVVAASCDFVKWCCCYLWSSKITPFSWNVD